MPAEPKISAETLANARARFAADARSHECRKWLSLCRDLAKCLLEWEQRPRVFVARSMSGPRISWCVARGVVTADKLARFDPSRVIDLAEAETCPCAECGSPALLVVEEFFMHDFDANTSFTKYAMCLTEPHVARLMHFESAAGGLSA